MSTFDFIKGDVIYDIETYPDTFTFCGVDSDGKNGVIFEISWRKNERAQMVEYLRKLYRNKSRMVGFNNVAFDYPVLHFILKNENATIKQIYDKAMSIIKVQNEDDKFANIIPAKDQLIKQVDLFKIHHFDNKARATSLKMIEFNMKSDNIEDLPFPVGMKLSANQIEVLKKYNKHDVLQTLLFYRKSLEAIRFREKLSNQYGRDFINHNDTKIGKDYFIMRLEEETPGCCYKKGERGRVIQQTPRASIEIGEIVFDYVKYDRPELSALVDWFKKRTITGTKGVFTDILEAELGNLAQYSKLTTKKKKLKQKPTESEVTALQKENPLCWVEEITLKGKETKANGGGFKKAYWLNWNVSETLNVVVDGFQLDFGTGGIHGSVESQIVKSDDDYILIDLDVASFYPNLSIANNLHPQHLGQTFCKIYKDVYETRKIYDKKSAENAVMKLALNGVYGDSNSEFSPFYDPKFTMSITINGQLLLCMIIDKLCKIESLTMVQANTDGLTVRVLRKDQDTVMGIVKWWEGVTGLELERNDYQQMIIANVNHYIAQYLDGKVKRKGAYEYADLGWNKNHSALVIKKAAEAALVYGKDVEEFIRSHGDKYDFMLRTKVPRSSRLVLVKEDGSETQQQNICRYYASKQGGRLVKIMPPLPDKEDERRIGIDKEWNVKTCNDIKSFAWDIDYDYYITQAKKLVDELKIEE